MKNCWHWCPERSVNETVWDGMYGFNKRFNENLSCLFFNIKKSENKENFTKLIKN